jgi:oligogalacturonide lyase
MHQDHSSASARFGRRLQGTALFYRTIRPRGWCAHGALLTALVCICSSAWAQVGRQFPSEKQITVDRITGRPLTLLTSGAFNDAKIYPTHPQWAADGVHILFRSTGRSADGHPQIFVVNELTGVITQLSAGEGIDTGSINVARLSNKVYYLRRGPADAPASLIEVELTGLLAGSQNFERTVGVLPKGFIGAGGFTLDANEKAAYFGFDQRRAPPRERGQPVPQVPGGLLAMDLASGRTRTVLEVPFRMGHVQANPIKPGEILYCHETGGDTPQRMWLVNADGSGNRPVFPEHADDWVTHEQFADADHVIFNLMGHTAKLRQRPTGIMVVNLRDGTVENLGQPDSYYNAPQPLVYSDPNIPAGKENRGGFWHNAVTYDRRLAAADDFDGNVHLIDRKTGGRTLLSTGHRMRPDHAHPSFSPDGARLLIQSGMLSDGQRLSLIVIPTQ